MTTASRATIELGDGTVVSALEWTPAEPTGLPVLLLHGGGVDSASLSWGGLGPALADAGHRVVAPDHPGFGQSPLAAWNATQERLVDYVGELAERLELGEHVVGGLSLGGGLTAGHALRRPDGLRGIMLFGSYGIMPRLTDGAFSLPTQMFTWAMLRTGILGALTVRLARDPKQLERSMRTIVRTPGALTPELMREVEAEVERGVGFEAFAQWQRDQVLWNRLRTDYADALAGLELPALIVHGTRDSGVPIGRARSLAERMPDARLLAVDGAGHWVQRDRPELVAPAVVDFLAAVR